MTPERIAELREAVATLDSCNCWNIVAECLDEIERLQACFAIEVIQEAIDSATAELRAENERLTEQRQWVCRKLGLPENATWQILYGQMHITCSDAYGMKAYIKAYKCDDKQGEIARLSVQLDTATRERDEAREALRGLFDEQNGPPLGGRLRQWQEAMEVATKVLKGLP